VSDRGRLSATPRAACAAVGLALLAATIASTPALAADATAETAKAKARVVGSELALPELHRHHCVGASVMSCTLATEREGTR
jgi:hypothetical protein